MTQKERFDHIIVIKATDYDKEMYSDINIPVYPLDEVLLETLIKAQISDKLRGKTTRTLAVFDDIIKPEVLKDKRFKNACADLFSNSRHYNLSTIWSTQNMSSIESMYRNNVDLCIIKFMTQRNNLRLIHGDFFGWMKEREFMEFIISRFQEDPFVGICRFDKDFRIYYV